jgi:hypothetical protein
MRKEVGFRFDPKEEIKDEKIRLGPSDEPKRGTFLAAAETPPAGT